jgi:hypothetical protein
MIVDAKCDIWSQDCPEGEKCSAWADDGGSSWNATKCVPVDGAPKQPGDDCTTDGSDVSGNDNCDKGSLCFSVNPETNVGTCIALCEGSPEDPSCADINTNCNISNMGSLILCLPLCNPLLQDCVAGGFQEQGCYWANGNFQCWPNYSGDTGAYGDPCMFFNVCDAGLFCANANIVPNCNDSSGCCTEFCDLDDMNFMCEGQDDGAECIPFFDPGTEPPGLTNLGVCGLMT